jgi:hypothetical protein
MASLLLRAAVFVVPIAAALGAATAASRLLPTPGSPGQFVAWWVALAVIALITLSVLDRLSRRLLPLAALLTLSMAFPDRAPSRFRVAREAASLRHLQRRLAEARSDGLQSDPARAAEAIITLITALGVHDKRTRGHSERVHVFTELLAEELGLSQDDRDRLRWASLLHDIGKLVVSSEILNKPGKPDEEEWSALRRHPEEGAKFIAPLRPFLGEWAAAVDEHHEWYDGSGYPRGLKGRDISRSARIVAVADAFEVMTAPRSYRRAISPLAARQELAEQAGTQFDPAIVRAFLSISIARLRRTIGPAALLAPLPTALRVTGYTGSVAQVGAVVGGAAILMAGGFGGGVTPAIADDPSREQVVQAQEISADTGPTDALLTAAKGGQRDGGQTRPAPAPASAAARAAAPAPRRQVPPPSAVPSGVRRDLPQGDAAAEDGNGASSPRDLQRPEDTTASDAARTRIGTTLVSPDAGTLPMIPIGRPGASPDQRPQPHERDEAAPAPARRDEAAPAPARPERPDTSPPGLERDPAGTTDQPARGASPAAPATPNPPQRGVNPVDPSPPGHDGRADKSTGSPHASDQQVLPGNAERLRGAGERGRAQERGNGPGPEGEDSALLPGFLWRVT